jgi:hypothetical protein
VFGCHKANIEHVAIIASKNSKSAIPHLLSIWQALQVCNQAEDWGALRRILQSFSVDCRLRGP